MRLKNSRNRPSITRWAAPPRRGAARHAAKREGPCLRCWIRGTPVCRWIFRTLRQFYRIRSTCSASSRLGSTSLPKIRTGNARSHFPKCPPEARQAISLDLIYPIDCVHIQLHQRTLSLRTLSDGSLILNVARSRSRHQVSASLLTQINHAEFGWSSVALPVEEIDMKKISIKRAFLATAIFALGALGSVAWSPGGGLSLSIESAEARVGRPLTPVSVAGVARRQTRRAVVGGAAVGAAAAGTACVRVLVNGAYVCR